MTPEVHNWVKKYRDEFDLRKGNTLDVGSRYINGDVRDLFDNYTGLDMFAGINVDVVANAHRLPFPDNHFDTVCCLELLEHDTNFFNTIHEAHRVLKEGGCYLLTARGNGYERHDYPEDYWRFTSDGFALLLSRFSSHHQEENLQGVYGWGIK